MSLMKSVAAAVVLSASIAAPAFAQDVYQSYNDAPYRHAPRYYRSFDVPPGSYAPRNTQQFWNQENFGFSGRDPSRTGGESPNLNPPS